MTVAIALKLIYKAPLLVN